jgi:hypothetical protein
VIGALKDAGMLVAEHEYIHSYACLVREIKTSLPALRTPFLTRL